MLPSGADSLWDYVPAMPGAVSAHDIAFDQGDIWVACENPGFSIMRFSTAGILVEAIERALVPSAEGLALDADGCLWVSDNVNGLIYRVDPEGTALEQTSWGAVKADRGRP